MTGAEWWAYNNSRARHDPWYFQTSLWHKLLDEHVRRVMARDTHDDAGESKGASKGKDALSHAGSDAGCRSKKQDADNGSMQKQGCTKRNNDDKSSDNGNDDKSMDTGNDAKATMTKAAMTNARKGSSSSELEARAQLQGPEAQEARLEAKARMLKARLLKGGHAEDKRRRV